ncbi:MAG: outer rane adhesin like protein [Capsulimonas sp.]|nr:outer rane adhesin like protein [Capsulimonas sp.]
MYNGIGNFREYRLTAHHTKDILIMTKRFMAYGAAILGIAASCIQPARAQIEYARNFVAPPGHGAVTVTGFNNLGQVSGFYSSPSFSSSHGFVWDPQSGFHDIASPGTTSSILAALNEQGRSLGAATPLGDFFRDPSGAVQWTSFTGFTYGSGKILTDTSQVAGHTIVTGHLRAARWDAANGSVDIGHLLSTTNDSDAVSISNNGFVAGYWNTGATAVVNGQTFPTSHAFIWNPGANMVTDLGGLGGYSAHASSVNNSGQVVGRAAIAGNAVFHAFLASATGTIQDLTSLLGESANSNSYAADINNKGEIIGRSDMIGNFVLSNGFPRSIHYAEIGHPMSYASDLFRINDSGVILGTGFEWDPILFRNTPGFIVLMPHQVPSNTSHSYTTFEDNSLSVPTGPLLRGVENQNLSGLTVELYTPTVASVAMSAHSTVTHGALVLNPNGSFTYTPTPNFNGADHFDFRIFDGISYSVTSRVTINVTPVNDPPVALDSQQTLNEDTQAQITPSVSDADGDALTYAISKSPAHGQVFVNAGKLVYTPAPNYHGPDSFQYKASDGKVSSNIATVTLTVSSVNDVPTVESGGLQMYQGQTYSEVAPGVLLNAKDVDGDPLTVSLGTPAIHGTLKLKSDGSYSYTPQTNYAGSDRFTFIANDGHGGAAEGSISINILPAAQNITSQISVTRGGYVRIPGTTTFTQRITLTNTGRTTITNYLALVLDNLRNATLINKTGATAITSPAGSPYYGVPILTLSPGVSTTISLKFSDPTLAAISYNPRVLGGPGAL